MRKKGVDYIVFPLDFPDMETASDYVRKLDGHVGMFKIGLELFIQEGPSVVRQIRELTDAQIFLDLKLHDISATVGRAMARVAELGVDLITVHTASSFRMLKMAVKGGGGKAGVLGVTLLTDNDAAAVEAGGFKAEYVTSPLALVMLRARMAKAAGCAGVVCSGQEVEGIKAELGPDFLAVTPGIRPEWTLTAGDDQKRVTTPGRAVALGSDYIVIGRPIRDADDPVKAADMVAEEIDKALADA
ncbi:MAG TPA: orotidine-5'-phosphate decarboxylase [Desulfobacteraceae bacterium]|nr:orotidine-5'-phosphate decarboxylase [Desulfobacteraceae bacterium]|tara:strand:- start:808 stop:1539 length:732 start_codon:yes stop_codon:yes gene_type:complete